VRAQLRSQSFVEYYVTQAPKPVMNCPSSIKRSVSGPP
jgi:hypothetical protein